MGINFFTKLSLAYILYSPTCIPQEVEIISGGNERFFRINLPSNTDEPVFLFINILYIY